MSEPYSTAAMRHWQDATLLDESRRLANADQLYGFAAECGLKSALVAVGSGKTDAVLPDRY
jgi:hypothetical protein